MAVPVQPAFNLKLSLVPLARARSGAYDTWLGETISHIVTRIAPEYPTAHVRPRPSGAAAAGCVCKFARGE